MSGGRCKLPVCVVRMRSVLVFMARILRLAAGAGRDETPGGKTGDPVRVGPGEAYGPKRRGLSGEAPPDWCSKAKANVATKLQLRRTPKGRTVNSTGRAIRCGPQTPAGECPPACSGPGSLGT